MKINKNVLNVMTTAIIAIALAGCGTTVESGKNEDNNSGSGKENSGIVAGSIVPSITEVKDGNHQYDGKVTNKPKEVIPFISDSVFNSCYRIDR